MKLEEMRRSTAMRALLLTLLYTIALTGSLWMAYLLRFDWTIPRASMVQLLVLWPWTTGLHYACLYAFRVPHFSWRYIGLRELKPIALAIGSAALVLAQDRPAHARAVAATEVLHRETAAAQHQLGVPARDPGIVGHHVGLLAAADDQCVSFTKRSHVRRLADANHHVRSIVAARAALRSAIELRRQVAEAGHRRASLAASAKRRGGGGPLARTTHGM